MRRTLLTLCATGLLAGAAALSGNPKAPLSDLQVVPEDRNPWTHLRLNNDPADFRFAIVSDRTGGHRDGVFARAVEQLNLLQPEFVITVGDLIEGYTRDEARLAREWKEFQGYVARLQMPFFYLPGNHDLANAVEEQLWKEKFGRRYYSFVYRDVLFLLLNSEEPPGKKDAGISATQQAFVKKALDDNRTARWTVVLLHRPLWAQADVGQNGWLEVEQALAGRPYTVFAGHVHRYQKFVRNGRSYYQLATTGGASKMRGVRYGEFDQLVWVTMKRDGPVLANILLDGVYPDDMQKSTAEEPGYVNANRKSTHPVRGKVFFEGTPVPHAQVVFHLVDATEKRFTKAGDAFVEPDGSFVLSTYAADDGAPLGDYAATVVWRQPWVDAQGKPGPNLLPERYSKPEMTELRVKVKEGTNEFTLELKK